MKIKLIPFLLVAAILGCRALYAEEFRRGDILANQFGGQIYQYRPSGELVQSFTPSGPSSEGATVTADGKVVTTFRGNGGPSGVSIFNASGNETVFATPEVQLPADVSVFADGTLAVNDQGASKVELYSPSGTHLATFTDSSLVGNSLPFGSAIGPDDTLWLALSNHGISRFARSGAFLGHFNPGFDVPDIGIDPVDGTLWIPSFDGVLHHINPEGVELGSFSTEALPRSTHGVAVAPDQSIYVSSFLSNDPAFLLHYNVSGQLLGKFPVPKGIPFISVQTVPEPSTAALLVIGCVLALVVRNRSVTF